MIQAEVEEVAEVFRSELRWMFGPYPALIPKRTWPWVATLDALCRGLRGRTDWSESERLFVIGAAAHLGVLVHECWTLFSPDVRVRYDEGVVCSSGDRRLPLEADLVSTLRATPSELSAPGGLALSPSETNALEIFGLAACLGMTPLGEGRWGGLKPEELDRRVDAVVPYLARTCAEHYTELYEEEPLGQRPELYRDGLIWPPPAPRAKTPHLTAAEAILRHLDRYGLSTGESVPFLRNLVRSPSETIRGGALICLTLDERLPLSGEIVEIACTFLPARGGAHRATAIELARRSGRNIDWLQGGRDPETRFHFERQVGLLPWLYLPYHMCVEPANRDLVEPLVQMNPAAASRALDQRLRSENGSLRLLFQAAMLQRERGELHEAETSLEDAARTYPDALDRTFYIEWARTALQTDRTEEAVSRLEKARRLPPSRDISDQRLPVTLGRAWAAAERHQEAVEAYGTAVVQGYQPVAALIGRGRSHRALGREDLYFRDLAAAVAMNPFNSAVVQEVMAHYFES